MEHPTINDLPNELLEMIFGHLDVDDLKNASLVCKRWLGLAFLGRRMDRVLLVPPFPRDKVLLRSNRKYRHLELRETEKCPASLKKLFKTIQTIQSVSSLAIKDRNISNVSLRLILLKVPNLQHLTINYQFVEMDKMVEPLPVMRKLEHLGLRSSYREPWHTIAPSLQGLRMYCDYEDQLEQWRIFSGQLKQVYATCRRNDFLDRLYELTFPLLEELSLKSALFNSSYEAENLFRRHEFFRRHASLRRLRLDGIHLSVTLVQDITSQMKKLRSLEIIGYIYVENDRNGEPGSLESLAQLTELKHLRLEHLNTSIFYGCEALTSLQSLRIRCSTLGRKGTLGFLEEFFTIAPQLRCLDLGSVVMPARAVQYICNKFIKLTRLQLTYSKKVTRDGLTGIHRLPLLWDLELNLIATNRLFIGIHHQNKVRYLTLHLPFQYKEDDLLRLPEIFPQLDRLNLINSRKFLHESTVDKLRQLLPTCAIKIYGPLITNAGTEKCFRGFTRGEMMRVWEKDWVWKEPEEWEYI